MASAGYERCKMKISRLFPFAIVVLFAWSFAEQAHAQLAAGVSAGFVTTAPTANPGVTGSLSDNYYHGFRHTAPEDGTVTEIGWWKAAGTINSNWEGGMYSDDEVNTRPDTLLGKNATNGATTSYGLWLRASGLSIDVIGGTDYWLAQELDVHSGTGSIGYSQLGAGNGYYAHRVGGTTLPDTFATTMHYSWAPVDGVLFGVYALYTPAGGGDSVAPVIMRHNRNRRMQ